MVAAVALRNENPVKHEPPTPSRAAPARRVGVLRYPRANRVLSK
jgi:hypothetical protein